METSSVGVFCACGRNGAAECSRWSSMAGYFASKLRYEALLVH